MKSLSKLKFSFECDACDREWIIKGIWNLFCKVCKKFYKPIDSKPYKICEDKIEDIQCIFKEFQADNHRITFIDPIKNFSKCSICKIYIQGFLFSKFFCTKCNYNETLDGLQKISNEKCFCGIHLLNHDYTKELSIISNISNVNFSANFICNNKSCNNIWVNNSIKFSGIENIIYDYCEKCKIKMTPFNIQIRKCRKINFYKNKLYYYDSETEYSEYTSDSDLIEELDINNAIDECSESSIESDI